MLLGRNAALWRERQPVDQPALDRQPIARPPNGRLEPGDFRFAISRALILSIVYILSRFPQQSVQVGVRRSRLRGMVWTGWTGSTDLLDSTRRGMMLECLFRVGFVRFHELDSGVPVEPS